MFTFKATLIVFSAAEARIDKLFESLLSEQLSKRTGNDFLISFDENELKIEFYDVELTEKFAPKILGCGTVKKFIIENHAEPKNKPEKAIEVKVKAGENEHVTGSETEAENESEAKKEETESDSEDDTDANAEAGAEETESEPKSEKIPEAEDEEEPKPEPEPEVIPEVKAVEETEPEAEQEVIPEVKAVEETEPEAEPEVIPEVKTVEETEAETELEVIPEAEVEEGLELEQEQEVAPEAKAEEKSPKVKSSEEFSKEYAEKLYEESENLEEFSGKLADYIQISDSRIRNAFEELIKAVAETQKMSWFCIENIIKRSSQNLCKKAEFNTNTKVLISKAVKERFNLTLLVFLKLIKELMIEVNSKAKENSEPESEPEVVSEAKAEEEPEPKMESEEVPEAKAEEEPELESEPEVIPEAKAEEEPELESEPEVIPEAKAEEEPELESEPEVVSEAKSEVEPKSKPELEEPKTKVEEEPKPEPEPEVTSEAETKETFDEYWSGIFKCMPKIISTDKYRIENVSKKEQQFLAINKSNPMAFRIKEVLEIMEDISLVADPNFITLSEQIFTKVPVIKVEKSMALYEKMRLLQWSKMLQKFVQRYYTKDPNFRVRIESFLTELREIIMTPEEIAKIK